MTNKKYKMIYDYKKRTNGGFLDAMFLSFFTHNRGYDGITFFDWGEINGFDIGTLF